MSRTTVRRNGNVVVNDKVRGRVERELYQATASTWKVKWRAYNFEGEPLGTYVTKALAVNVARQPRTSAGMSEYARLTTVDHTGRRQTGSYRIDSEGDGWLVATRVSAEGEDDSYVNQDGVVVERKHLIEKACIIRRVPLVMNLHYGRLERQS